MTSLHLTEFLDFIIFIVFIKYSIEQTIFSGDGTVYADNLNGGSCGFKQIWTNNLLPFNNMGIAMNAIQYNNSLACGRCVSIHYQDRNVKAIVADLCPECKFGDIDMFKTTWDTVMQITPSRQKITWEFIDCEKNFVNGNVQLRIDELNYYWLAIQPENFKCGISEVYIYLNNKWIQMSRNDNGMIGLYFIYNGFISGNFKFKIINIYGEELLSNEMNLLANLIDMNGQFKCQSSNFIEYPLPTSSKNPKYTEVSINQLGDIEKNQPIITNNSNIIQSIPNNNVQPYNLDC